MQDTPSSTRPQIDERTEAELIPPCEARMWPTREACPDPAAWIARIIGHPSTGERLLCNDHAAAAARLNARGMQCGGCGASLFVVLEPLNGWQS